MPLSTDRNQLKVFERTLKRVLALKKANTLNHIKFRKPLSGRLRKISMPSRIQEVISQEGGMTRYISTNNTVDTFDTVYSYFH